MVMKQRSGSEHLYDYQEYPKVVYHPTEEPRTITSEAQEEKGWYDDPVKAAAALKKQLDKTSKVAQKGKDAARQDKIDNPAPPAVEETPDTLEEYSDTQLMECAVEYETPITEDMSREALIVAIKRSAGYRVDNPGEDSQEQDKAGKEDETPGNEQEPAREQDSPTPEIPSKSAVIKLRHGQLYALAHGLSIKLPTDPNDITRGEMITAILKIKGGSKI